MLKTSNTKLLTAISGRNSFLNTLNKKYKNWSPLQNNFSLTQGMLSLFDGIDWKTWFYEPGLPPYELKYTAYTHTHN